MIRYEILLLTIPEITEDEARSIETQLEGVIKIVKGTVVSFERWGKYRLAYPINKHEYGVYFLVRFEITKEALSILDDIDKLLSIKLQDLVMRSMLSRLDIKQSLVYQRSPSLEEAPRRDMSGFLGGGHGETVAKPAIVEEYEPEVKPVEGEELKEEEEYFEPEKKEG